MLDQIADKLNDVLDRAGAWVWESFEKDMAWTDAMLERTEAVYVRISRFFR